MIPKISVITVCFNSEKTIEKTIKSVLDQTIEVFEYIIIDGKSTDDTMLIVEKYQPLFDGRMKVVSEIDNGIYDAMNKGIKMASGDLINLLNSDDYFEKNTIENVTKNYDDREKHQIIYGLLRRLSNGQEKSVSMYNHKFLDKYSLPHQATFVSKAVYDDYGMYSLDYKCSSDHEFFIRIFKNTDTKFKPIYTILANFGSGGFSSTPVNKHDTAKIFLKYNIISKQKYIALRIRAYILSLHYKLSKNKIEGRS